MWHCPNLHVHPGVHNHVIFVREIYAPGSCPRTLSHVAPAALLVPSAAFLTKTTMSLPPGPLPSFAAAPCRRSAARSSSGRGASPSGPRTADRAAFYGTCAVPCSRAFAARCHFPHVYCFVFLRCVVNCIVCATVFVELYRGSCSMHADAVVGLVRGRTSCFSVCVFPKTFLTTPLLCARAQPGARNVPAPSQRCA